MSKTAVFLELEEVMELKTDNYTAKISKTSSVYVLEWWDGVVQHEQELYPNLATALLRLAVLQHASRSDKCFATTSASHFAMTALDFLEDEVE